MCHNVSLWGQSEKKKISAIQKCNTEMNRISVLNALTLHNGIFQMGSIFKNLRGLKSAMVGGSLPQKCKPGGKGKKSQMIF